MTYLSNNKIDTLRTSAQFKDYVSTLLTIERQTQRKILSQLAVFWRNVLKPR